MTKEGRRQHHCVGASDQYMAKMASRQTFILFLRKKDDKEVPYYTLEVEWNGKIRQWYGAYDRQPDKEEIQSILNQWTQEIEKRQMEEQREQIKQTKILAAV
ncbi:MAG: PcfJ domain-containing protein [Roseburia sp.]